MLDVTMALTIIIVILALSFDFINGFHDTANAIATSVSTRVLSPKAAIVMAAALNLAGAFISVTVAKTIGAGLVDPGHISQTVIIAALLGAIVWNLITWYFGIPSSSSHALIGGILGSAIVYKSSFAVINWGNLFWKVLLWLVLSPVIGFIIGYAIMAVLNWILRKTKPAVVTKIFSKAQIASAAAMALNHGGNDAQKSMGVITMALLSAGLINQFVVPDWVKFSCAAAMAIGTSIGGWRIIKTMGMNMAKLAPVNGFAAEAAAASIIFTATMFHAPVSTTHIISGSIMGVGASKRLSSVRWSLARSIVWAWVFTIPVSALISGGLVFILMRFFG
jgi:PiT family inorganic phosphate transporter